MHCDQSILFAKRKVSDIAAVCLLARASTSCSDMRRAKTDRWDFLVLLTGNTQPKANTDLQERADDEAVITKCNDNWSDSRKAIRYKSTRVLVSVVWTALSGHLVVIIISVIILQTTSVVSQFTHIRLHPTVYVRIASKPNSHCILLLERSFRVDYLYVWRSSEQITQRLNNLIPRQMSQQLHAAVVWSRSF